MTRLPPVPRRRRRGLRTHSGKPDLAAPGSGARFVFDRFRSEIARTHIANLASSSAFWLFLSLLPLAAVAGMVVAKIGMADVSLLGTMLAVVPPSSRALMRDEFDKVAAWNGGAVAPTSAAVFVWLASMGIHAILDAFDITTESVRPWWRKRAIAIAMCVALSLTVACAGALVGFAKRGNVGNVVFSFATAGVARYVVGFLIETVLMVGLFATGVAPQDAHVVRWRWPGAALAAAMHTALGVAYAAEIRHLGDGGAYRAGLAVIGITMIIVYLFTLSLLVGLAFNKTLGQRPEPRSPVARALLQEVDVRNARHSGNGEVET